MHTLITPYESSHITRLVQCISDHCRPRPCGGALRAFLVQSEYEAGTWLAREDFSFVKKLDLPCGTGLYMGTFVSEVTLDTTCRLIYQMILQMEAIEVENLRAIVQQWAPPYSLKTDAVQFDSKHGTAMGLIRSMGQVEAWEMQDWVHQQFWDQEHTIPKYRYVVADTIKPLSRPAMADFVRE